LLREERIMESSGRTSTFMRRGGGRKLIDCKVGKERILQEKKSKEGGNREWVLFKRRPTRIIKP